jgi:4-hydroxy-3-methylbut-2-en-1-yl diphosphate reductase
MTLSTEVAVAPLKVLLSSPRGFCAGVARAVDIVDWTVKNYPCPIYVRKQIVHNCLVVKTFEEQGVIFVDTLDEVPDGGTVIFSAHGVSPDVRIQAKRRHLHVIDATCPLVTKVHQEAIRFAKDDRSIILIGEAHHDEVVGILGEVADKIQVVRNVEDAKCVMVVDPDRVAVISQTTLSLDDTRLIVEVLRSRFPKLVTPVKDDICYATQNRQAAVKALASKAEVVLVVGSRNSSNSNRLKEVAEERGARAYLVEGAEGIDAAWLAGAQCIGVTAGASSPECLVQEVLDYFRRLGVVEIEELESVAEDMNFARPSQMVQLVALQMARLPCA